MKHIQTFENFLEEGKKKGLWPNIEAKRKRGEKPAKPGDEDYPDEEAWKAAQESESGLSGAIHTSLGPKQSRVVIAGDSVEQNQDKILAAISKIDKDAKVDFFAATKKIVGVIAIKSLSDIKKELAKIDKSITAELKSQSLK